MSWLKDQVDRVGTDMSNIIKDPVGTIKRGPRGMWRPEEEDDEEVGPPTMSAGDIEAAGEEGALQEQRRRMQGRAEHNLASASGSSILTQS